MKLRPTRAGQAGPPDRRRLRSLLPILVPLLLAVLAWVAWPYLTLWRLDRALLRGDTATLARLVDLESVRAELRRSLNKNEHETLGPRSDRFADWLAETLRRGGPDALERAVTLDWVRQQMLSESPPGAGLAPALTWAFFRGPFAFVVRLGKPDEDPVLFRMRFTGTGWRMSALAY
jgi:hypothetical protein